MLTYDLTAKWQITLAEFDGKIADQLGNSTFILKLVSGSFHIQKCNLRPTLITVTYFELQEKLVRFFPNNVIPMTYLFQYWFQYT